MGWFLTNPVINVLLVLALLEGVALVLVVQRLRNYKQFCEIFVPQRVVDDTLKEKASYDNRWDEEEFGEAVALAKQFGYKAHRSRTYYARAPRNGFPASPRGAIDALMAGATSPGGHSAAGSEIRGTAQGIDPYDLRPSGFAPKTDGDLPPAA